MKKKKIIGYTTGVFDLFHVGHLNILKKASANCDYLIVGVTADETVFQYKKRYPIIGLKERIEIIAAIKYVDQVVIQRSMDKKLAWENYNFDILFHGDDWKGSNMYKEIEEFLTSKGVIIKYFEYSKGVSTTELKSLIYERLKTDD